jgi:DnaJ-domain-containing protein 1
MTVDTLAYSKHLEAAGIDRQAAEAQAEALTRYVLPDLVTKADLAATKTELEQAIERSEHRLTLRVIGIVGAFNAALFALLRFVH